MDRSFTLACSLSTKVSIVEFCLGENALEQNILTFVEHTHASYCNAKAVDIFTSTLTASSTITKVDLIVAVSVYLACRVEGYPRLLDEVGQASGIDPKEIRKIQGPVARKLSLSIGVIKPSDVCNRMAVQLCFSFHQRQFVYDFCQEIAKYELFDTSPPQLVVAGVLAWTTVLTRPSISNNSNDISTSSSNSSLSIHELCRVCFVPVGAVNKMFLELYEYLPVIAPSELSSMIQEVHPRLSSRLEKYLVTQSDNSSDVVIVHYEASRSSNERKKDSSQKKKRKIGEV